MTDHSAVRDLLWLNMIEGIGPRLARALLDHFGSADRIRAASPADLAEVDGIGGQRAEAIAASRQTVDLDGELALAEANGVRLLAVDEPAYPPLLKQTYSPPLVLYTRGEFAEQDSLAIAIVGTRKCSHYGRQMARKLAGGLAAAGVTIVSGLARGIDAEAHRAALAAGGRTLAVLAHGLAMVYPPEHRKLADEVIGAGALVSELPMRTTVDRGQFPQRNRIISGLSLGVVVVEAGERSGSLITARQAVEENREVFAVPGHAGDQTCRGCHRLIRDGAKLVETAGDILEELGPLADGIRPEVDDHPIERPSELTLNTRERQVYDLVEPSGADLEAIVARSGLPASQVSSTLTILEMRRLVHRVDGTRYARGPAV